MLLILAALLAVKAPEPPKDPETCPATPFTFKKPPEAAAKSAPKPKTLTVQSLNVQQKTEPKPKADDCLTPKPKQVKRS